MRPDPEISGGPASPAPLVFPRRERWVDVPEYPGWKVRLWVNHPAALHQALYSSDEPEFGEAFRQVVVEHNGWVDERGDPYPPASDSAFWEALPNELGALVVVLARRAPYELPNSLTRSNGRSASG